MQSKNALSNLKNRYAAVLKKCALLNVFGTLAVATMLTSPFMAEKALAADNPVGLTINSMNASSDDYGVIGSALNTSILNNFGNINGGAFYTVSGSSITAGMFGSNSGNIDYTFNNIGTINVSDNANVVGMIASSLGKTNSNLTNSGSITVNGTGNEVYGMGSITYGGNHNLTNSGSITVNGTGNEVYGMVAYTDSEGNHVLTNSGSITVSGTGDEVYGMEAYVENSGGSHSLTNSGSISVSGTGDNVYGMSAYADSEGNHVLTNNGSMTVKGARYVYGMSAWTDNKGNHVLTNSGPITVSGNEYVYGVYAYADTEGNHNLTNSGSITVSGTENVFGMSADANDGNHKLTNSGTINVNGTNFVNGMYVRGTNANSGIHYLNNTGIITAKASTGSALEVYGDNDYTVGTWATTLRTWDTDDSVFGGAFGIAINLADSALIFRPQVNNNVVELNADYNLANLVAIAGTAQNLAIGSIKTEVPFLKAVVTGGTETSSTSVRLEANINEDTTSGNAAAQGNLALVQGQMSNITRKLLQTRYLEIYADLVSDNGNSGIAAGSQMQENPWTVFLTPYGSYTNNSSYNFDGTQVGLTGGASYAFSDKFSLGAHFDLSTAVTNADILNMETDSDSFAFGLHANYNIMPQWYVSAQATGSISQNESDYSLETGSGSAEASFDSQALYLALNSGYVFEIAKGHTLTPQIGFSYLNMQTDAYDIDWATGYSMYDMEYDSTSYSAFYADFSLNWHSAWQLQNNSVLSLLASAGVRQNLSGSDIDSDFRLLGSDYSTRSSSDDTTLLASAGLEWTKNNFSLSVQYNGEYGSSQQFHGGAISFKYHF